MLSMKGERTDGWKPTGDKPKFAMKASFVKEKDQADRQWMGGKK